jgi:hypothetical protein
LPKVIEFREHSTRDVCKGRNEYSSREGKPKMIYFRENMKEDGRKIVFSTNGV